MERSTQGTGVYVSKSWIGSNLADMGRERCVPTRFVSGGNSWAGFNDRPGDHGEVLRGSRGEAAGTESGSSFVERITVNTGTVLVPPRSRYPVWSIGWAHRPVQDGAEPP